MTEQAQAGPNAESAAPSQNPVVSDDSILAKMTAMRNQVANTPQTGTGEPRAAAKVTPVAPEILSDDDVSDPEVVDTDDTDVASGTVEPVAPDDVSDDTEIEVSTDDTSQAEVIDFIAFADEHPNAKFKFIRNGKEVEIDAKKAAAILGQGGAIHEEARQLKIEKAEFDEYLKGRQAEAEGLLLAMEFTVKPELQKAYDEILKTQGYQNTFQNQLARSTDPAEQARIRANMQQNEKWIAKQSNRVRELKPNLDQFYDIRRQQVQEILQTNRKAFTDKELRNEYVYNEVRDKVAKGWAGAKGQLVPGIDNLDLISADEHIISLLRDGLKYREKPRVKSSGSSIAALTNNKRSSGMSGRSQDDISNLREKAKSGDKKAQDNLLVAQLTKIRQSRTGR